jgi:hypothetical protein
MIVEQQIKAWPILGDGYCNVARRRIWTMNNSEQAHPAARAIKNRAAGPSSAATRVPIPTGTQRGIRRSPRRPWPGRWSHREESRSGRHPPTGLEPHAGVTCPGDPLRVQRMGYAGAHNPTSSGAIRACRPKDHRRSRRREGEARH